MVLLAYTRRDFGVQRITLYGDGRMWNKEQALYSATYGRKLGARACGIWLSWGAAAGLPGAEFMKYLERSEAHTSSQGHLS